jgi:glycosyltransferase involved in cell wall biosynthesis
MPVKVLPFPVDVERFLPNNSEKTITCFLYFKGREKNIQQYIQQYLQEKNISFVNIEYGKYKEEEYIDILNKVKFGIWVGCHESQGFALEEALSMNVPLLVYNVKTLYDEVNHEGNHTYIDSTFNATSVSYWDERCGEIIYELSKLEEGLEKIRNNNYKPREYILETLSPKVCYERLRTTINL